MRLSIIIPSFNTAGFTQACLESIYQSIKDIDFEIIVVDNASSDNSVDMIKKKFPLVKVIKNIKNLGFAKANNQALKHAKGKYILFLNSDTVIINQAIKRCLDFIQNNKQVDILGCKILNKDKSLQCSGGFFPNLIRIFYLMFFIDDLPIIKNFIRSYQIKNKFFYSKIRRWDWATGAFLMVSKKVIDKIGDFDENFFMYFEEVDFCFRAKKAGFLAWFYPEAKIIHYKGASSSLSFEKAICQEYLGLVKFYKKYYQTWQIIILKIFLKLGALLRIIIFGILKDKDKKKTYEKAYKVV